MVEIEKPRIECIDSQDDVSYGKYIVEPHLQPAPQLTAMLDP